MKSLEKLTIVSDFDGTLTDLAQESVTFALAYKELFANKISLDVKQVDEFFEAAGQVIKANPGAYGWEYEGMIVAPATSDPYLLMQAEARYTLSQLKAEGYYKGTEEETTALMQELFYASYKQAGIFFKEDARQFVLDLHKFANFYIVTNSKTDAVKHKIALLLNNPDNHIQVVGNARKFVASHASIELPGFPRPVYPDRPEYLNVLNSIGPVSAVCGDIFELDLVAPQFLGAKTVLLTNQNTPPWEEAYYKNHPTGKNAASLTETQNIIFSR